MVKKLICLGIESTAHTAGIGIVDEKGNVLASEKHSHTTEHGGIIPRELSEHHAEYFPKVLTDALGKAKLQMRGIDCIAYSAGPGIGPSLSVGATVARMLSIMHSKPIIPVNHSVAHIEIAKKMCRSSDPLVLYVSGGNSQVIGYEAEKYRVYGETLDIGVGNLLDSFGRKLGLGFPAGPVIDGLYFKSKNFIELPYSVKGMDVAFSGLLTAAGKKITIVNKEDLCYSLAHTAFAMLTEVCERALSHTGKKELLLTGGVAASIALQQMITKMCKGRKVKLKICPREFTSDNGVMIAWTGILMQKKSRSVLPKDAFTNQNFRTDLENVDWN